MRLEIGYEDFVAQFRMLFDQPESRWHEPLLATRGERQAHAPEELERQPAPAHLHGEATVARGQELTPDEALALARDVIASVLPTD